MPTILPPGFATVEDVAQALQLKPETVREMARTGRLPAHKVGRVWRFDLEEIRQAIRQHDSVLIEAKSETLPAARVAKGRVAYETAALPDLEVNGSAFKDPAFSENRSQPVHRWVPWIAGFSAGFVSDCLHEYLGNTDPAQTLVMDPFAGVGTTLVEAYRHGYNTVGFEINPYAVLATRAKLGAADVSIPLLEGWVEAYRAFMRRTDRSSAEPDGDLAPAGFRSRISFYSPAVERQVLWTLQFITNTQDQRLRDLFLVAFGSVMVKFSNYTYEPSLTSRPGCGKPLVESADVAAVVLEKLEEIVADARLYQRQVSHRNAALRRSVFQTSIFDAHNYLDPESVDLAITSPPYLNNYHYIRNTRPQLFWLRFIERSTDLRQIEEASFGKFWQTVRDGDPIPLAFDLPDLQLTLERVAQRNNHKGVYGGAGWANYAAQYFNDTYKFCGVMRRLLKPGAKMVVVIGNSVLQGIEIKVEEYLARIASLQGLRPIEMHMLRTKRVGNSIIRSSVRNAAADKVRLYEVAVVIERPAER